ncbi:MAG: hypothetical protein QOI80_3130, partial [Solirubrobacteraceae bacterium]|nr:hypothetical protein [Solirubrobacteraceae bacterium]
PTYPPQQQAFDIAHRLRDQLGGADVQPDLPSDAFAPPPERRGAARATAPAPRQKDWSLTAVRAQQAWDLEPTRGAGIVVGHPDTGYTVHKELEAGSLDLARAWNVIDDNADARDPLRKPWWSPLASPGHGTGTASAIVGRIAGQVSGTAPGATLVPLRTVKSVVQVFDGDVGLAIERARQQGCHVVSMSLGGVGFSGAVRDAISAAVDSGMIVMAAAGNYVHFVTAPASWPECLAIGATNVDSKPWSGSSRGPEVDFCAPGEAVWAATAWRDGHAVKDEVTPHYGTSFAVATTAGVAALWLGLHGVDALRERYGPGNLQRLFLTLARSTAREPADWDRRSYGAGILDARALLEAQLPDPATFARAAAGGGPRKPPDALDRLATLWPDLSRSQVKSGLATALGKRGKALDELL